MKLKFKVIIFSILLLIFSGCSTEEIKSFEELCLEQNGKWLEEFKECEYIFENQCLNIGGKFNDCESICRHREDKTLDICFKKCVPVCNFNAVTNNDIDNSKKSKNNNKIPMDSFGNIIPESCKIWYDGCNSCVVDERNKVVCTEIICSPDNIKESFCRNEK